MGGSFWRMVAVIAVAIVLFFVFRIVFVILWKAVTFAVLGGLALLVASLLVGRWSGRS